MQVIVDLRQELMGKLLLFKVLEMLDFILVSIYKNKEQNA